MITVNPSLDVNEMDGFGMTPLMIAVSKDRADVLDVLVKQRQLQIAEQDYRGWTAVHWAASCGSIECIQKLLSINRFNLFTAVSVHGDTPIHLAAREGNTEVIQEILSRVPLSYKDKMLKLINADGLTAEAVCPLAILYLLRILKPFECRLRSVLDTPRASLLQAPTAAVVLDPIQAPTRPRRTNGPRAIDRAISYSTQS